ncbi:MAG TPA: hypothetical protein VK249_15875 [Anaerolineales bacterium]|nr:hypothetical protein [Anaerolineales bacterium]
MPCRLVGEEAAIFRIRPQFYHFDLIRNVALPAEFVPPLQPGIDGVFLAQANHHDIAFFLGADVEFPLHFLQIQRRDRMVERHDLDQLLPQRAIEEGLGFRAGHAEMLDG